MSLRVYTAELAADALTQLIGTVRDEAPFAIVERPDEVEFPGPSDGIDAATWAVGHVFGPQVELHWEKAGAKCSVRLANTQEDTPPPGFSQVLSLDVAEETVWYYLREGDEGTIPGQGRGQLGVMEYRDEEGRLVFYRYVGLKREVSNG